MKRRKNAMRRLLAAAVFALAAAAPAAAAPPLLEQAIAAAEAAAANAPRFAFTQRVDADGEVQVEARYDPVAEEGARWSLLSPAEADLGKAEREVYDGLVQEVDADIEALVDEPREMLTGAIKLLREDERTAVFEAPPPADDEDDADYAKFRDALIAEVTVDKICGCLASYRLRNVKAFKPAVVAKVNDFDMTITFAQAWENGPLITSRVVQQISGSALFQKFEQTVVIEMKDFAPVG